MPQTEEHGARLLLVEEDADMAAVLEDFLVARGYEVLTAGTAEEARRCLARQLIDVLIVGGRAVNELGAMRGCVPIPSICLVGMEDELPHAVSEAVRVMPRPASLWAIARTLGEIGGDSSQGRSPSGMVGTGQGRA